MKKVIFSGIQPSGTLTLGNYLGAMRNWAALQEEYDCIYCVVDLHALTVKQDPDLLRRRSVETLALIMAAGLDPERNILFFQSHVSAHAELSWILTCMSYMGELSRMTQFKEKSAKQGANIGTGLLVYPSLMAADILLYQADLVPVGADQKQHLELSRDLAIRFNNRYGETFVVPDAYIPKVGARVMSLTDPTRKMSKSDEAQSFIGLLDAPDVVVKKFKRAVTDSDGQVRYDPEHKPGVSNLLSIYASLNGIPVEQAAEELGGGGYGPLKQRVTDAALAALEPLQAEYARLMDDQAYLRQIAARGAQSAAERANRTLKQVYDRVGLLGR